MMYVKDVLQEMYDAARAEVQFAATQISKNKLVERDCGLYAWCKFRQVSEDSYAIEIEHAGVDPDKIDISVANDPKEIILRYRDETKELNFIGKFPFPKDADPSTISADSKFGLMTISVKKKEEAKPKKVKINVA